MLERMPVAHSSHPRFGIFNTEAHIIYSSIGAYQIGVWLPFSYGRNNKRFPVLYVLDGDYTFGLATGLIPTLIGTNDLPELIIVGVAYHSLANYKDLQRRRERDFLPKGFADAPDDTHSAEFIEFIANEVIPWVDQNYLTDPEDRGLYGFSTGGFFALNLLLNRPELFQRYITASGTWAGADTYLLECAKQAALPTQQPTTLYMAVGEREEEQRAGFSALNEVLRHQPDLQLHTQVLLGEAHGAGVIAQSFLYGLRKVYGQS